MNRIKFSAEQRTAEEKKSKTCNKGRERLLIEWRIIRFSHVMDGKLSMKHLNMKYCDFSIFSASRRVNIRRARLPCTSRGH